MITSPKTSLFSCINHLFDRPILEYGHSVWHPYSKMLQREVEDVQRRATKMLSELRDKPYPERLALLKLPSLEHRRLRGDMIDTYKYLHGIYHTDKPKLELFTARDTRGNIFKLAKPFCRINTRKNFFSARVVPHWNSLPDLVVTAPSVNAFKNRLDAFWCRKPEMYDPDCYH